MSNIQPEPIPEMTVAGNRNVKNVPVGQDGREWSHGLCDYFGACGTCCLSYWCPCITYSKIKHRLGHLNTKGTPDPENGGCCNADCMIHGFVTFCGFGWVMQYTQRGSIRDRYGIKGGSCRDCCTAFWCTPCELTQESREIELEENSYGKY